MNQRVTSSVQVISWNRPQRHCGRKAMYIWMSSAYWWISTWWAAAKSLTGATHSEDSNGPSTEPCGSPDSQGTHFTDCLYIMFHSEDIGRWSCREHCLTSHHQQPHTGSDRRRETSASLMLSHSCRTNAEVAVIRSGGWRGRKQHKLYVERQQGKAPALASIGLDIVHIWQLKNSTGPICREIEPTAYMAYYATNREKVVGELYYFTASSSAWVLY